MFPLGEPHGLLLIDIIKNLPKQYFTTTLISVGSREPDPEIVAAMDETHLIGFNFFKASGKRQVHERFKLKLFVIECNTIAKIVLSYPIVARRDSIKLTT